MIKAKSSIYKLLVYSFFIFFLSCKTKETEVKVKQLSYPSGSGIEFYKDRFYLIGDDAPYLLELDNDFNVTDSIQLYPSAKGRFPKEAKPDLEGITFIHEKENMELLITGSGSLRPYRNTAWLIDPVTKQKSAFRTDSFCQRLASHGLKEINLEGVCAIQGFIILSNRGNKSYQKNFLILTDVGFLNNQSVSSIRLIQINTKEDTAGFKGVSGLAYAPGSDKLILTVSTEDTRSAYEDGTIGKSFLWIINNISSRIEKDTISPDRIIDLESIDSRFSGQKVESVCVISERKDLIHLGLTADNDNGSSTIFKMSIKKD